MSPSAVEKVRQLQQQAAEKAAREEKNRKQAELERERQELLERQKRIELTRRVSGEVFQQTGIVSEIEMMARSLIPPFIKNRILVNLDFGTVTLVWGKRFKVKKNKFIPDPYVEYYGLLSTETHGDYSYIEADVDSDTRTITVRGCGFREGRDLFTIPEESWKQNRQLISDALAACFLEPHTSEDDRDKGGIAS